MARERLVCARMQPILTNQELGWKCCRAPAAAASQMSGPRRRGAERGTERCVRFRGKLDVELTQLGGLGDELLVGRPSVLALDREGALQAFGTGQLFPGLRRGFGRLLGVIDDLGGDGLGAFAPDTERVQGHVDGGLAGFLAVFVDHAQPFRKAHGSVDRITFSGDCLENAASGVNHSYSAAHKMQWRESAAPGWSRGDLTVWQTRSPSVAGRPPPNDRNAGAGGGDRFVQSGGNASLSGIGGIGRTWSRRR